MSFNAFMSPTLPQTPAAGFNDTGSMGPTAINSPRNGESAQEGRSFLATLNQISDGSNGSSRDPKPTESTGPNSEGSNPDSPITATSSGLAGKGPAGQDTPAALASEGAFACINPWEAFGLIRSLFFGFSMNADLSIYYQDQAPSTNDADAARFDNPAELFQSQGQGLLMAWLAGMHPDMQIKADISPDANNLHFFKNLAAQAVFNQDIGVNMGVDAQFWGLRHWTATMPGGNLNAQTAAFGSQAHPALMDLLNLQAADSTVLGLNPENGGLEGRKTAAYPGAIDAIKEFILKMASPTQAKENDLSDNAKMAVAGKASRLTHWARSNPDSDTILDPQLQRQPKNESAHKFQAAAKTTDSLANPQIAADALLAKPSEDVPGMKNPNLKTEMPLSDAFGHKAIQVEGDNKESSLAHAQDQMPERMFKLENQARTSESAQHSHSSRATNQIVQKAVLLFHNGQNEVQIHLKPEFLGHIRMQIVTENQQVAIRIVAELPFVKDMLENNLNQLKADLQAQGLKIDELEVSVAQDSNAGDKNQAAADRSKLRVLNSRPAADDQLSEEANQSQGDGAGRIGETVIDYFA